MFYLHTPPNLPNLVQVQTGAETQVPPTRDLEFSFPGPELSLAGGFSVKRVCLLPAYTAQCKSEQEVLKVRIVDPEYNGGRGASSVYAGNGDKLWSAPPSLARFDQMQVWWTRMRESPFQSSLFHVSSSFSSSPRAQLLFTIIPSGIL